MRQSEGLRKSELYEDLCNLIDAHYGAGDNEDFSKYQDDPVAFGEEILGETYTPEVRTMMESTVELSHVCQVAMPGC